MQVLPAANHTAGVIPSATDATPAPAVIVTICPEAKNPYLLEGEPEWKFEDSNPMMFLNKRISLYNMNARLWGVCIPTAYKDANKQFKCEFPDGETQWTNLSVSKFSIIGKRGSHIPTRNHLSARTPVVRFGQIPQSTTKIMTKPLADGDCARFDGKFFIVQINSFHPEQMELIEINENNCATNEMLANVKNEHDTQTYNLKQVMSEMSNVQKQMVDCNDSEQLQSLQIDFTQKMKNARDLKASLKKIEGGEYCGQITLTRQKLVIRRAVHTLPVQPEQKNYSFENGEFISSTAGWVPTDRLLGQWRMSQPQPVTNRFIIFSIQRNGDTYEYYNAGKVMPLELTEDGYLIGESETGIPTTTGFQFGAAGYKGGVTAIKLRMINPETIQEKLTVHVNKEKAIFASRTSFVGAGVRKRTSMFGFGVAGRAAKRTVPANTVFSFGKQPTASVAGGFQFGNKPAGTAAGRAGESGGNDTKEPNKGKMDVDDK